MAGFQQHCVLSTDTKLLPRMNLQRQQTEEFIVFTDVAEMIKTQTKPCQHKPTHGTTLHLTTNKTTDMTHIGP